MGPEFDSRSLHLKKKNVCIFGKIPYNLSLCLFSNKIVGKKPQHFS